MDIRNADDARAWLRAWNGVPRRAVLRWVLEGQERAVAIMRGASGRYSAEQVADGEAAIVVLRSAAKGAAHGS
jgi:hypothetical protein